MDKKKQLLINFGYYAVLVTLGLLATYIAFTWLLPIFISILVVMALQPLIANIVKGLPFENKYALLLVSIIVYLVIIAFVIYLIFLGMVQLYLLVQTLPVYIDQLFLFFNESDAFVFLDGYTNYFHESIRTVTKNLSTTFIDYLFTFITKIPSLAFDLMFIVISSMFFIIDYKNIRQYILKYSPRENYIQNIIGCIKDTISSVFKAYLTIFIVTFIELLIGFYIIGINDALMLSFGIAFFDFLPILGLDMIFIPWIIVLAFQNRMSLALSLLIVYLISTISKNVLEPKLISKHIGLHPLLTIMSMFIGVKFLGVLGIVVIPLLMMVIKRIYELHKEVKSD
jgi:sporulation integral membrane protein YtvI